MIRLIRNPRLVVLLWCVVVVGAYHVGQAHAGCPIGCKKVQTWANPATKTGFVVYLTGTFNPGGFAPGQNIYATALSPNDKLPTIVETVGANDLWNAKGQFPCPTDNGVQEGAIPATRVGTKAIGIRDETKCTVNS